MTHVVDKMYNGGDFSLQAQSVSNAKGGNAYGATYAYDADGLITSITDSATLPNDAFNINRGPSGRISSTDFDDASHVVATTRTYDAFAQLKEVVYTNRSSGATIAKFTALDRDELGRLSIARSTLDGVFQYHYLPAGFLDAVWVNADPKSDLPTYEYSYDVNGNRLGFEDRSQAQVASWAATYDDQDRIATYLCDPAKTRGCGTGTAYQYDYADDLSLADRIDQIAGTATYYDYDLWGDLLAVQTPSGATYSYTVDPHGHRIARTRSGSFQFALVRDTDGRVLAQTDSQGNIISRFYYATSSYVPDLMYSNKSGSWAWYRFVTDLRGSVRLVVDASTGALAQRMDYSPFGRVLNDTNPGFQPFGFAGGLYDPDTGLVRFGARDYDAITGRWTNKDPIRFDGGDTNLYGYVMQDPVNLVDPSGLAPTSPSKVCKKEDGGQVQVSPPGPKTSQIAICGGLAGLCLARSGLNPLCIGTCMAACVQGMQPSWPNWCP